jgi:hypothetical protein
MAKRINFDKAAAQAKRARKQRASAEAIRLKALEVKRLFLRRKEELADLDDKQGETSSSNPPAKKRSTSESRAADKTARARDRAQREASAQARKPREDFSQTVARIVREATNDFGRRS